LNQPFACAVGGKYCAVVRQDRAGRERDEIPAALRGVAWRGVGREQGVSCVQAEGQGWLRDVRDVRGECGNLNDRNSARWRYTGK
jgi:hypothetical protein